MFDEQLFSFVLILARISAFVGFFPLFSQRQLPVLVKAGMAWPYHVLVWKCADRYGIGSQRADPAGHSIHRP